MIYVSGCRASYIAHNRYRLIAEINFEYQSVFVKAILSHAEYDRGGWEE